MDTIKSLENITETLQGRVYKAKAESHFIFDVDSSGFTAHGKQCVVARVFERGEGPTASSGTSATAVACAAWRVGWVRAGEVKVTMPGGTAPILLEEELGELSRVSLFGTARLIG